jgi:hypothetical protein
MQVVVFNPATANAGTDTPICGGQDIDLATLGASYTNPPATSADWTVIGGTTGVFKDALGNILSAPYTFGTARFYEPSTTDISTGRFDLLLSTDDPTGPCPIGSDAVRITVNAGPTVNAGLDTVFCAGNTIKLSGSSGGSTSSVTWTTNGQGTFSNQTSTTTEYLASSTEKNLGAVITMTLTSNDPGLPCTADDDDVIIVINQRATIDAGADFAKCADEPIVLNGSVPANSSTTAFHWSGGSGDFLPDNSTSNATYSITDPSEVGSFVTFTITSDDPDGAGPCLAESDDVSVQIKSDPGPPTVAVPPSYCVGNAIANLTASGFGIKWYSDVILTNQVGVGGIFPSGISNTSDTVATFFVTQSVNGCESTYARDSIIINPLPTPVFSVANFCLNDSTQFTDASTLLYNNGLSGSIVNWSYFLENGFAISPGGVGALPPGTHNNRTLGTYENPGHIYGSVGTYDPVLTVTTSDGCSNSASYSSLNSGQSLRIGPVPIASFDFKKICEDDVTDLFGKAGPAAGEPLLTWAWDFADPTSGANSSTQKDPSHLFSAYGAYPVELVITTPLNCKDSITINLPILPYIKTFPYPQDFETANHGWVASAIVFSPEHKGLSSWQWNQPNGTTITSTSKAWFTRVDSINTYFNTERSALYGPCVDVALLDRPILSFDHWSNLDNGNDGVYMEVAQPTANGDLTWSSFGNVNNGINWYDRPLILGLTQVGGIGQSVGQVGWTGDTKTASNPDGWVSSKYSLDQVKSATKLMIRFVFGSNSDNPDISTTSLDGFALDNFRLDSRNRVILAENFTNSSEGLHNAKFINFEKVLTDDELVKLQYHTGFGGADPIYEADKVDPNARVAFYGLNQSDQLIPRVFLDGHSEGAFTGTWMDDYYSVRALDVSPYNITITSLPATEPGAFKGSVSIECLQQITKGKPVLHYAVVEKTVGINKYVVRKMLPSPSGTPLELPLALNQVITFPEFNWVVSNGGINVDSLAIVAFIQDENTGEVYQTSIEAKPANLPSTITGVEPTVSTQVKIYPSPADDFINVELPKPVTGRISLKMFDVNGHELHNKFFEKGERSKVLDTHDFADGVYLIQVEMDNNLVRKKVMVIHD